MNEWMDSTYLFQNVPCSAESSLLDQQLAKSKSTTRLCVLMIALRLHCWSIDPWTLFPDHNGLLIFADSMVDDSQIEIGCKLIYLKVMWENMHKEFTQGKRRGCKLIYLKVIWENVHREPTRGERGDFSEFTLTCYSFRGVTRLPWINTLMNTDPGYR